MSGPSGESMDMSAGEPDDTSAPARVRMPWDLAPLLALKPIFDPVLRDMSDLHTHWAHSDGDLVPEVDEARAAWMT